MELEGKRALVCGSTRGIGRACAEELARFGAAVTLAARDERALSEITESLRGQTGRAHDFVCCDFSRPAELDEKIKQRVETIGGYHILVNNTGGPPAGAMVDAEPEQFETAFRTHLVCNHLLSQALIPGMKQAGYGRIINIISTSVKAPIAGLGVSNTIRGAVAAWAKTLAGELGPFGITVNNVLPGFTATDRLASLIARKAKQAGVGVAEIEEQFKAEVPLRRFARPDETAAAVVFLASPMASYISGINLPVDGGRTPSL